MKSHAEAEEESVTAEAEPALAGDGASADQDSEAQPGAEGSEAAADTEAEGEAPTPLQTEEESKPVQLADKNGGQASTRVFTRAANDPRVNPKPVRQIRILTETRDTPLPRMLDTSQPARVAHNPRDLSRPANDPRLERQNSESGQ